MSSGSSGVLRDAGVTAPSVVRLEGCGCLPAYLVSDESAQAAADHCAAPVEGPQRSALGTTRDPSPASSPGMTQLAGATKKSSVNWSESTRNTTAASQPQISNPARKPPSPARLPLRRSQGNSPTASRFAMGRKPRMKTSFHRRVRAMISFTTGAVGGDECDQGHQSRNRAARELHEIVPERAVTLPGCVHHRSVRSKSDRIGQIEPETL